MRTYIRLFIFLLMPLTLLFSLASIGYFNLDYPFSKAIRLGILSGVFLAINISLGMSLLLIIKRKIQEYKSNEVLHTVGSETANMTPASKEPSAFGKKTLPNKEIKCMFLMDKELTYHVLLNALKEKSEYVLSKSDPKKGTLSIETKEGIIQTSIKALTQHTSQIILYTENNINPVKDLISHLKEKEHSFLQY